eukprot:CAMPEP_0115053716 /NCGR_PEP_ID=MMETSP0227-20121206/3674_1 /TAXON_ID=89957 /ORGANISM="Polarella glacialis, Strain CCMP 1383" /LENGTH=73 /DNA_ID=CAMNT_0002438073 /DNA_START=574 /DNA_END=796 /DNA_ORIENTATION=-
MAAAEHQFAAGQGTITAALLLAVATAAATAGMTALRGLCTPRRKLQVRGAEFVLVVFKELAAIFRGHVRNNFK